MGLRGGIGSEPIRFLAILHEQILPLSEEVGDGAGDGLRVVSHLIENQPLRNQHRHVVDDDQEEKDEDEGEEEEVAEQTPAQAAALGRGATGCGRRQEPWESDEEERDGEAAEDGFQQQGGQVCPGGGESEIEGGEGGGVGSNVGEGGGGDEQGRQEERQRSADEGAAQPGVESTGVGLPACPTEENAGKRKMKGSEDLMRLPQGPPQPAKKTDQQCRGRV